MHDGTLISSSFFMLEYIAEALPGESPAARQRHTTTIARAPRDNFSARSSDRWCPILGCVQVPRAAPRGHGSRARSMRSSRTIEPLERRLSWLALLDGTYTPQILDTARERLKFPVARIEAQLAQTSRWLAGPRYSIADIDAFAMLRVFRTWRRRLVNASATPRIWSTSRASRRVRRCEPRWRLSRSGKPEQHFVPGSNRRDGAEAVMPVVLLPGLVCDASGLDARTRGARGAHAGDHRRVRQCSIRSAPWRRRCCARRRRASRWPAIRWAAASRSRSCVARRNAWPAIALLDTGVQPLAAGEAGAARSRRTP